MMPQSPRVFVTGATGQLGQLVIEALLRTMPASAIVAGVRDPAKNAAAAILGKGVEVRVADYARPETLTQAFTGVDRLLFISGTEMGGPSEQHRNVVTAAKKAGVGLVAYTSLLHAGSSPLRLLADKHRDTEAALVDSGLPHTFLRNGWYTENFAMRLPGALASGTFDGAAGDGRVSAAARADYADAAAAVLTGDGHAGRTYELAGDASFTLAELTAVISEAAGKPVVYRDMTPEAYGTRAVEAGMPEPLAQLFADSDAGTAKGALFDDSGALSRLIGRPTTSYRSTIATLVQNEAPGV